LFTGASFLRTGVIKRVLLKLEVPPLSLYSTT